MSQVEILPQSIVNIKTIVMKPRLDQGDIKLIAEKIKPRLFGQFLFGPKPREVRLLGVDTYFEPYLVIGGKYSLDYCRKHVFKVNVKQETTKIFVAGQEFRSEQTESETTGKTVTMVGEEYAHHEKQGYYVLDRLKREILPERLPISPFDTREENAELDSSFRSMQISDETQIQFLKRKIAQRPADLAEIIREVFDVTERTIAYYPMYQLFFENSKNKKDATVAINGVTGEITLNGIEKIAAKTVITSSKGSNAQPAGMTTQKENEIQTVLNISPPDTIEDRIKTQEERSPRSSQTVLATAKSTPQQLEILNIDPKATERTKNAPKKEHESLAKKPEGKEENFREKTQQNIIPKVVRPSKKSFTKKTKKETLARQPDVEETMTLGFPAKIHGKVLSTDENVEAIVGDLEIPSGTNIDKTLVVKGTLKIGDNCRAHGKLKALKDIRVGADTIIDGDVISGGNVFIGRRSLISGSVKAAGIFEIEENAFVEGIPIYSNKSPR